MSQTHTSNTPKDPRYKGSQSKAWKRAYTIRESSESAREKPACGDPGPLRAKRPIECIQG